MSRAIGIDHPLPCGATVWFRNQTGAEAALTFYDHALTIRAPFPVVADAHGRIELLWVADEAPPVWADISSSKELGKG